MGGSSATRRKHTHEQGMAGSAAQKGPSQDVNWQPGSTVALNLQNPNLTPGHGYIVVWCDGGVYVTVSDRVTAT